jgi:hypothetical protein
MLELDVSSWEGGTFRPKWDPRQCAQTSITLHLASNRENTFALPRHDTACSPGTNTSGYGNPPGLDT